MKTDLFQSYGHCWVFQICWQFECGTFIASSFRIWNSSTGIPSPPLALFVVMLSKAHLTSHSRMSGSRWVITPSWLSGLWRSFLYSSFVILSIKDLNWHPFETYYYSSVFLMGFSGSSDGKASAYNVGDSGLIPGSGRSPGEGNDHPLQYSCLKNPMDRGAWWLQSMGSQESWTQLRLQGDPTGPF